MAGALRPSPVARQPPSRPVHRRQGRARLDSPGAARLGRAMAPPMIPPAAAPAFLAAHGWEGAEILPLAGDASFRRYFRVVRNGESAVLMDAPPEHKDVGPFLKVAYQLLRSEERREGKEGVSPC